jgi:hypothetical protein
MLNRPPLLIRKPCRTIAGACPNGRILLLYCTIDMMSVNAMVGCPPHPVSTRDHGVLDLDHFAGRIPRKLDLACRRIGPFSLKLDQRRRGHHRRKRALEFLYVVITACDKFVYFDVLKAPGEEVPATPAAQEEAKAKATKNAKDKILLSMLRNAVTAVSDEGGWANLGAVGSHVAKQSPEFDSRNFGFARLSDLVEATAKFEMDRYCR